MPGGVARTGEIMRFLAREISENVYVNVMDQHRPAFKTDRYPEIHQRTMEEEHQLALESAREEGIRGVDSRA